jgi:hypothetical protein
MFSKPQFSIIRAPTGVVSGGSAGKRFGLKIGDRVGVCRRQPERRTVRARVSPAFPFHAGHPGGNGDAGDDHQPTTFY